MITFIQRIVILPLAATFLAIGTGCNTAHGLGKDGQKAGEDIQSDAK